MPREVFFCHQRRSRVSIPREPPGGLPGREPAVPQGRVWFLVSPVPLLLYCAGAVRSTISLATLPPTPTPTPNNAEFGSEVILENNKRMANPVLELLERTNGT